MNLTLTSRDNNKNVSVLYTGCQDTQRILSIFTILICVFGILGNGIVIWLLGFCIKKNPFTIYILNLAVADFSFLTIAVIDKIYWFSPHKLSQIHNTVALLFAFLYFFTFSTSQSLLTAISMDRCVSVFFPLWHRCRRPTYLSAIVCALIWLISFLPPAISVILKMANIPIDKYVLLYQFVANGFLCLPLMTISSLMLFIKVFCKSKQQRRGKVLITILLTVFFFCFFCFPFNALTINSSLNEEQLTFLHSVVFCACLNSSVNPLIYYLVGRPKKGLSKKSMKAALQRLFKEGEI
uniref:G-protein coupled receptors family 1 profile domain-containing protein n=1 Tax=Salvator merianae TaxID=96440 RepID=A0A8D0BBS5_SALMN